MGNEAELAYKKEELWLKTVVLEIPEKITSKLVAHRGFHHVCDGPSRPLENTLPANLAAWGAGVKYCECDIITLADGTIIVNHDSTLERLICPEYKAAYEKSSEDNSATSEKPIYEQDLKKLTFEQIEKIPLKNGYKISTLEDLLNCARETNGQLIIELKVGTTSDSLIHYFTQKPQHLENVAVIMSFERILLENFATKWAATLPVEKKPKTLLLSVSTKPEPHETYNNIRPQNFQEYYSIRENGLDGLYLEWEPSLLEEHIDELKTLCQQFPNTVGLWFYGSDPFEKGNVMEQLIDCGVSFVNTDFARGFPNSRKCLDAIHNLKEIPTLSSEFDDRVLAGI